MTLVIGLVTEGPNDRVVISAVTGQVISRCLPGKGLLFRQIQPASDQTSSGGEPGGWSEVRKWCMRTPPKDREILVFGPSLTGEPACDVLVVQLDGDCLGEYERVGSPLPPPPWTSAIRSSYVCSLLSGWLWPDGDRPKGDERTVLLIPVWSPETWLAAALDEDWQDPEERDPVERLIALRPDFEHGGRSGYLRKRGMRARYQQLSDVLVANIEAVRARCEQLDQYCSLLESLASR